MTASPARLRECRAVLVVDVAAQSRIEAAQALIEPLMGLLDHPLTSYLVDEPYLESWCFADEDLQHVDRNDRKPERTVDADGYLTPIPRATLRPPHREVQRLLVVVDSVHRNDDATARTAIETLARAVESQNAVRVDAITAVGHPAASWGRAIAITDIAALEVTVPGPGGTSYTGPAGRAGTALSAGQYDATAVDDGSGPYSLTVDGSTARLGDHPTTRIRATLPHDTTTSRGRARVGLATRPIDAFWYPSAALEGQIPRSEDSDGPAQLRSSGPRR